MDKEMRGKGLYNTRQRRVHSVIHPLYPSNTSTITGVFPPLCWILEQPKRDCQMVELDNYCSHYVSITIIQTIQIPIIILYIVIQFGHIFTNCP